MLFLRPTASQSVSQVHPLTVCVCNAYHIPSLTWRLPSQDPDLDMPAVCVCMCVCVCVCACSVYVCVCVHKTHSLIPSIENVGVVWGRGYKAHVYTLNGGIPLMKIYIHSSKTIYCSRK